MNAGTIMRPFVHNGCEVHRPAASGRFVPALRPPSELGCPSPAADAFWSSRIGEIGPEYPLQVTSVEDDHMMEAFAPNGSNQPFDKEFSHGLAGAERSEDCA